MIKTSSHPFPKRFAHPAWCTTSSEVGAWGSLDARHLSPTDPSFCLPPSLPGTTPGPEPRVAELPGAQPGRGWGGPGCSQEVAVRSCMAGEGWECPGSWKCRPRDRARRGSLWGPGTFQGSLAFHVGRRELSRWPRSHRLLPSPHPQRRTEPSRPLGTWESPLVLWSVTGKSSHPRGYCGDEEKRGWRSARSCACTVPG